MKNLYSKNTVSNGEENTKNADQNLLDEYQMLAKLDILLHSCYTKIKKNNNTFPKTMIIANNQVVS